MKKIIFLLISIVFFNSCYVKNNRNFSRQVKRYNMYYLCYMASEPKIVNMNTLDSVVYKYLNLVLERTKSPEKVNLISAKIIPVNFFFTKYAFEDYDRFNKALNFSPFKLSDYLSNVNVVYFISKNYEKDLKKLKYNYFKKQLNIFDHSYFYKKNDSTKVFISYEFFNHNKHVNYDDLIKLE